MIKNKKRLIIIIMALLMNMLIILFSNMKTKNPYVIRLLVKAEEKMEVQVFYSNDGIYSEEQSTKTQYTEDGEYQLLTVTAKELTKYIRIDLGDSKQQMSIAGFDISSGDHMVHVEYQDENLIQSMNMIDTVINDGTMMDFVSTGNDPFIIYEVNLQEYSEILDQESTFSITKRQIAACVILDIFAAFVFIKSETILEVPLDIYRNRKVLYKLSKNDFKTKFAGSYFGIIWAFVQPVVTTVLYWIVFQYAFGSQDVNGYPYVLWLVTGLVPWFFFQEAIVSGSNALLEYSYLVKKVVFNISILPTVKIISAFFVHLFFMVFVLLIFVLTGNIPTIYAIQLAYYVICMWIFIMGIIYATSAIVLFFRDLGQIINILMQVLMWSTPIMWQETTVQGTLAVLFKLNPMYYIVLGYRDSLINHVWFFEHSLLMVYFWVVVGSLFIIGTTIFRRLRPHFADVL